MTTTVALIDYGSGNLRSAEKALARAASDGGTGHEILVTSDANRVAEAERIVLPGVGAFADCMKGVSSIPGMVEALEDSVLKRGVPFLGICVGMQLLAEVGREHGDHKGLGWIPGEVVRLTPAEPHAESAAYGMECALAAAAACAVRRHGGRDGCLFRPLLLHPPQEPGAYSGDDRLCGLDSRPSSAATISPARNSIRRRARRKASPSSNASSNGGRKTVILFPAIDLKDGRCVRLRQGDMAQATVFNDDAAAQAARLRGRGL